MQLAAVYGSWNVEKGNGNGLVQAENKEWCHIVTMRPPIVKTMPGSRNCLAAASKAWACPFWITRRIGAGKSCRWLPCMVRFPCLRELQFWQGSHSSMPWQPRGGQSANTCRDYSPSYQKSTATQLGTLSCASKQEQGQINPLGAPCFTRCDLYWRGYMSQHRKTSSTSGLPQITNHKFVTVTHKHKWDMRMLH